MLDTLTRSIKEHPQDWTAHTKRPDRQIRHRTSPIVLEDMRMWGRPYFRITINDAEYAAGWCYWWWTHWSVWCLRRAVRRLLDQRASVFQLAVRKGQHAVIRKV